MGHTDLKSTDIFECAMCGQCCHGFGGTYVTPEDIEAIADFIGHPVDTFASNYCKPSGSKLLLAQGEDGNCIFFKEKCSIHPVKPKMCRAWPFLPAVLKEELNWQIMADCCPGCKGDAPYELVKAVIQGILDGEIEDLG